jgi:AAA+ ATPase superfamily predicted ATPase
MDINNRVLNLLFKARKQAHENFKGYAKINATEGGAPEHFDHSSNVKEIIQGFIKYLTRETRASTPLEVYKQNIENASLSDFVIFGSTEAEHLQSSRLLRLEVSNSQNGNAMTMAIQKLDNEIYKRIVKDEEGTGSVVDVLKSIFLMCSISPSGIINAAQVKLKCNFLLDEIDDRSQIEDNLINQIQSKFNFYFEFSRENATNKLSSFRELCR